MTCTRISGRGFNGIVCGPDHFVSLEPFGARVWCEFHHYLGPSFYRGKDSTVEIANPSRKTWRAFEAWMDMINKKGGAE